MKPTYNYHYNMIKGRVAEAIIKELFQANNYRVYDYGMERILPHAIENVRKQNDDMALRVRHMPDFIVQHIPSGKLTYVEVKYRAKGNFTIKDIEHNPYSQTCFVVVSKTDIQWIEYAELLDKKSLPSVQIKTLENCPLFQLGAKSVEEYRNYAKAFFEGVK